MTNHTEEIDRYLEGTMTPAEQAAFERRMAEDEVLATEFALQQKIYRTLRDREANAFHQKLQAIRKQKEALPAQKLLTHKWKYTLILLVCLTGGLIYWFTIQKKTAPVIPPASSPQEVPESIQTPPPSPAKQPGQNPAPFPARPQPQASVPSEKILALVEEQYNKNLFSNIDRGLIRSNNGTVAQTDTVMVAFNRKDYRTVLQIAEKYPEKDPNYNVVIWTAANAAFLQNDCRRAIFYSKMISEGQAGKTKAMEAEMLLLLTYLKCGMTDTPQYQELIQKCEGNKFHPAHELAIRIKGL